MALARRMRSESPSDPLPGAQMTLLGSIDRLGANASPSALAERHGLRSSNLAALLSRLETAGYIKRVYVETDRRKIRVVLTQIGQQKLETNRAERALWLDAAMRASLNTEERALLQRAGPLLERLASYTTDTPL